jgi:Flp pilus assembly protein TadB
MLLVVGGALLAMFSVNPTRLQALQRRRKPDEVQLLAAVLTALRAGHSLRTAVAGALDGDPNFESAGRLARVGAPITELGTVLADLPANGKRIGAALTVLEMTGGKATAVFDRLLAGAVREADLARERRQLTAQARASALVVAALPAVATVLSGGRHLLGLAQSGSVGLTMTTIGVLLQVAGLAVVWRLGR